MKVSLLAFRSCPLRSLNKDSKMNLRYFLKISKEGKKMRKMMIVGWLILFLPAMVFAQEKIEAPVWDVGDKWAFTGDGTIEVMQVDQNGYVMNFLDSICVIERQGFNKIIFDKSSLQRSYSLQGEKRRKYSMGLKNIFNFPFSPGKQWKHEYSTQPILTKGYRTSRGIPTLDYYENIRVLGWEDLGVKAGKFRALRIEFISGHKEYMAGIMPGPAYENKGYYWYSPEVKYFVKRQYDKDWMKENKEIFDWELASFKLKK
jgi:hypothetical protein